MTLEGKTPALRLFSLLEIIARKDEFVSLKGLIEETEVPKATLHRMLNQLEDGGLIVRQSDGRHYGTGARLRRFGEELLLNATQHGAQHTVLLRLVEELGETCNITALSGGEVIYLDRVETPRPLRFSLHPGSRVPLHCTASGKMFLAQLTSSQLRTLLAHAPLQRHTDRTLTDLGELERHLEQVRQDGFAVDDEEFLPGLICVAVPVPNAQGQSNLCVAVQAPAVRLTPGESSRVLPALRRAARAIRDVEAEGSRG
ncbi:MAG: IclR family transcriptional regulator [Nitriliruptor sp.]|nr:MAG: IclR family transcriptional regulator [Nitriliruptor sp.]